VSLTPKQPDAAYIPGDDALRELCFSDNVFRQRYRGWAVLGRGSVATVVRTFSGDAGRDIAVKVFLNLQPEMAQRIREEVRATQVLATPYLVQTYSLFDRGPIAWFEMELVEGLDLQQEIDRLAARGESIPLPRAFEIALAVSRCLWQAHRHGVLHRDVKPANVLLPALGQPAAKVTDFGIARLADTTAATPPGSITGTPRFASPEALAGKPVGTAHDVFGLCTTLYALFSGGALPFQTDGNASLAALRRVQVETRPTPLGTLAPGLDPAVSGLVMRGLSRHAFRRPGMKRIVLALERAQARGSSG
jgi:serine/threonine-protein kinase